MSGAQKRKQANGAEKHAFTWSWVTVQLRSDNGFGDQALQHFGTFFRCHSVGRPFAAREVDLVPKKLVVAPTAVPMKLG
jgi:hypothetical protein